MNIVELTNGSVFNLTDIQVIYFNSGDYSGVTVLFSHGSSILISKIAGKELVKLYLKYQENKNTGLTFEK